jgi:hypothetical protein
MKYQTRDKTYPLANLKPMAAYRLHATGGAADEAFKNAGYSQISGDFEGPALARNRYCRQGV